MVRVDKPHMTTGATALPTRNRAHGQFKDIDKRLGHLNFMLSSFSTLLLQLEIMRLLALLLLTAVLAVVSAQEDYCFGKDRERTQTRQFSSKTAYQIVKGTNMDKQYDVPGCTAKKIWIFHRHGTRLPTVNTIKEAPRLEEVNAINTIYRFLDSNLIQMYPMQLRDSIVKNYRELGKKPTTDALCSEDLLALQFWKWNSSITVDVEQHLTSQGYQDLRGTAKRYQEYYPSVLPKIYNNTYYLVSDSDSFILLLC